MFSFSFSVNCFLCLNRDGLLFYCVSCVLRDRGVFKYLNIYSFVFIVSLCSGEFISLIPPFFLFSFLPPSPGFVVRPSIRSGG